MHELQHLSCLLQPGRDPSFLALLHELVLSPENTVWLVVIPDTANLKNNCRGHNNYEKDQK